MRAFLFWYNRENMSDTFDDFLNGMASGKKAIDFRVFKGTDLQLSSHVPFGIPTGIPQLDLSIGRKGYPAGRIIEVFGFEHCIDADTFIQFQVRSKKGKVQNAKGGTIEDLYYRFHRIRREEPGRKLCLQTIDSEYFVPCMTDEGYIINNRIKDVVDAGTQNCFTITTKNGLTITTTEDHKFFTGTEYTRLKNLNIGDPLIVSIGERQRGVRKQEFRPEVYVKYHPFAKSIIIQEKYTYKRLAIARAAYEAYLNDLEYDDYIDLLNNNQLSNLKFVSNEYHIHHIDENFRNNSKENLIALTQSEHLKYHAKGNIKNLSYIVSKDTITSIDYVGPRKVYDIKMEAPFHNYVANKFIVHNSGKSCTALAAVASVQRLGGYAVWIDTEYCFDPNWAKLNGCDPSRISVAETECIEGIFEIQQKAMESYEKLDDKVPFIVIADSITGVPSKETLERSFDEGNRLGTDARAIRLGLKKLNSSIAKSKMLFMFINHSIAETNARFASSNSAGGHALKFFSGLRIKLTRTSNLMKDSGEDKLYQGMEVKISIEKNKIGKTSTKSFECSLLENGFDLYENLFDGFQRIGIIQKVNNRSYLFEPTQTQFSKKEWKVFVDEHTQGLAKAYEWFLDQAQAKGFIKDYGIEDSLV